MQRRLRLFDKFVLKLVQPFEIYGICGYKFVSMEITCLLAGNTLNKWEKEKDLRKGLDAQKPLCSSTTIEGNIVCLG